ncbi:MAG: hypothetical protein CMM49_09795 [Rhodospirillaceae bacterium]|nr:hypothetical protein [Rhodospirillaceae bacterium]|tara:strand:- start:86037 stop:87017 length:981 start_codon:yes stop_codon:yes gene_type:complete
MEYKIINRKRIRNLTFAILGVIFISHFIFPSLVTHSATIMRGKIKNQSDFVSPAIGPDLFKINHSNEFAVFIRSSSDLIKTFKKINFELDNIIKSKDSVPRIYVSRLPFDIDKVQSVDLKKSLFIKILLPLILQANEKIENDRTFILSLENKKRKGVKITLTQKIWLIDKFNQYDLKLYDFKSLLNRHNTIPPSLALAQSIIESGWGTSRFAKNGNAVFGQWTYKSGTGLVPLNRSPGQYHEIRSFDKLEQSVEQYIFNLNYHRAYRKFRNQREKMNKNKNLDIFSLADTLDNYSVKRKDYVKLVKSIILSNNLQRFDKVGFRDYF